jgi:hypothetical protein
MLFHWEITTRLGAAPSTTSTLAATGQELAARLLIFCLQDCLNRSVASVILNFYLGYGISRQTRLSMQTVDCCSTNGGTYDQ